MRTCESYVYIVASRSRTIYIGMTNRLQARVAEHKAGTFEGFRTITAALGSFTSSAALDPQERSSGKSS